MFDKPLVSIIIPVHNQFNYTFQCINSILTNDPIVPYEIIIADDMSSDKTKIIEKYIKNIIVLHNNKKNNFLFNCNKASKFAKGKYIIFLNNDTKVNKEWLISLVRLIESDEKIGMIGSKLLNFDGTLQEAGGIVWDNGGALNFGRNHDANMPEYNYVKEVDYISGASIIIRKSIWDKIGGFDERFSPAYYEDTDFAFELRKFGYKVMYQPKSIVIHFEGISNGKNLTSGIKKYQIINRKKFIEKWKNELKYQTKRCNIFVARDRGYNKRRILVLSGSFSIKYKDENFQIILAYLNILKEIGLQVTFFFNDFQKIEPYTSFLQQKGIEVLYGNIIKNNFVIWLKKYLKFFHFIYLQNCCIPALYLDLIFKYFKGKIFYFFHNNLFDDYYIKNKENNYEGNNNLTIIENKIISKANIIHVINNYEMEIIKEKYENTVIHVIPKLFYEYNLENVQKDFSKRKDIIFVGDFDYSSNIDAVLWFSTEIYPNIVKKYPDIIFNIIGKNVIHKIKKLHSKNIKIKIFRSYEELQTFYQESRMAIAPFRFGRNNKYKIIEAAYNQIPMVTTSIGVEDLCNSEGAFIIEDNAEKISLIISQLYFNYTKLKQMSDSGRIFIEKYFSKEKAKDIIFKDIS